MATPPGGSDRPGAPAPSMASSTNGRSPGFQSGVCGFDPRRRYSERPGLAPLEQWAVRGTMYRFTAMIVSHSLVAQRQSARLLTGGFLVRIQTGERKPG